ncbi:hypothetical protein V7056_19270 [Bacillus sp. JJ664]
MGCNRNNDFVGGESDRNRNKRDFTFDAKIRVDRDEFCRAVDRCIDDRVAGAEDRRDDRDRNHCGWRWI